MGGPDWIPVCGGLTTPAFFFALTGPQTPGHSYRNIDVMFRRAILYRLILFIRFYFTVLCSEPFLRFSRGRLGPRLPVVFGSDGPGMGAVDNSPIGAAS